MGALSAGNYALSTLQEGMTGFLTEYASGGNNNTTDIIKLMFLWFSI